MSDIRLSDVVILHDKELARLKKALPAIRTQLSAQVESSTAQRIEAVRADIAIKQAVVSQEAAAIAKREMATHANVIRTELTELAETKLAGLITTHEGKLGEIRPQITKLAEETALRVTSDFTAALPDYPALLKKELAALPAVGTQLVRANKGNWKDSVIYSTGDIIAFRGSSYLVLRPNKRGEFPALQNQNKPTAVYQILAAAGSPGPAGRDGTGGGEGSGTVTSVSVVTANGFAGSVANATTTPAITLTTSVTGILKGNGTAISAAVSGTDYLPITGGTGVTTLGTIGTGTWEGTAIADSYIASAATWNAKQAAITFGTGVLAALGVNVGSAGAPVLFNGAGGTPSSIVLTNATGTAAGLTAGVASAVAVGGITGLGTNVATALAVNVGSAGAFVTFNGALGTPASGTLTSCTIKTVIQLACSDTSTAITAGTGKITFRMPHAMTLTDVRASVSTAPTGSTIIIDINESGSSILSTKISIDASEKTSTTAATQPVISDASLADDAEITIDFDQVGSTIAGVGVVVTLIGTRS